MGGQYSEFEKKENLETASWLWLTQTIWNVQACLKHIHETHCFSVEANISYINLKAFRKTVSRLPFPRCGSGFAVPGESARTSVWFS